MRSVRVTDHAMVRYLERAGGFDIARLRAEIARRIAASTHHLPGSVDMDGLSFVVRDEGKGLTVTTVMIADPKPPKPAHLRQRAYREVDE